MEYSINDLESSLYRLERLIAQWCVPPMTFSEMDMLGNRMVVGVQDLEEFLADVEAVEDGLSGGNRSRGASGSLHHPGQFPGCALIHRADLLPPEHGGNHWGSTTTGSSRPADHLVVKQAAMRSQSPTDS